MRLSNGFVIDKEKTFGELKFTAVRDVFLQNEDGTPSTQLKKRIYDLKCSLHGGIIPVSVPPEVPLREFPYNAVVELVNPVADDFLMDSLVDGGVMKRIDLAINDHTGILDIPELAEKCRKREYIGKSRSYKFYQSGELIKHREDDREYMGRTLYLGSLKSDVYFCIYEKDYEQYVKLGTPLEEADIINRFEIRLRNERAYYAVRDLLTYYDAEQTAFSIINQYVRFVDEEPDKRKNDWKLNDRWAWFIGDNRQSLKLTTKPEPYTLDRTLRWVQRQVAPTLKMLKKIDKGNGTDYMETIEQQAKLTEKHEMIIKQQTTPAKDLVES